MIPHIEPKKRNDCLIEKELNYSSLRLLRLLPFALLLGLALLGLVPGPGLVLVAAPARLVLLGQLGGLPRRPQALAPAALVGFLLDLWRTKKKETKSAHDAMFPVEMYIDVPATRTFLDLLSELGIRRLALGRRHVGLVRGGKGAQEPRHMESVQDRSHY